MPQKVQHFKYIQHELENKQAANHIEYAYIVAHAVYPQMRTYSASA